MKYLETIYDPQRTPASAYPSQLVAHLKQNYLKDFEGKKLVELGCGRGDFLNEFSTQGFECIGVDRDPSARAFLSPKIEFVEHDLSLGTLPFDTESVDVIYHKSFLEHVYDPIPVLKESLRVLKKGGRMIILTPDWETQWKVFYEDFTHCRPFTITALEDSMRAAGFEVLQVSKFVQLPYVWNSLLLKFISRAWGFFFKVKLSRWLTQKTKIKFFRWSSELMLLGVSQK